MIRVLLVDDESHATQALAKLLEELAREAPFAQFTVAGICSNGVQAVKAVHDLQPDLMLLDIQMPKVDGFEVLELLGDEAPPVVFVTAYDEYAIAAFEHNALDYLLKPVARERLAKTLERVVERRADQGPQLAAGSVQRELVEQRRALRSPLQRILVRERGDVFVVPVASIIAIESADDYVVIHTLEANHVKQERLGKLEELLDPDQFCRIHRSCLINLDYLEGIETDGKDSRQAKMKHQRQFAISRSGYQKLVERL